MLRALASVPQLKEKLGRYSEYLKTGNVLTDKVKQVTVTA